MASLSELIAHGGVAGAIVEALVVLAIVGVFVAVWLRERLPTEDEGAGAPERLSEDDSTTS
jgi:hypothetical protein